MGIYNLDDILENRTEFADKKIVLHCCCAVCAIHVSEVLKRVFREVVLYFYNPNIQPKEEYDRRFWAMQKVAEMNGLELAEGEYDAERWMECVRGLENDPEGGRRCEICFEMRLEETARFAAERDFDFMAATLTVSPYKDPGPVNRLGREAAEKCGVEFLPTDFKKKEGFRKSMEKAKHVGIYRQNYCGCIFSKSN